MKARHERRVLGMSNGLGGLARPAAEVQKLDLGQGEAQVMAKRIRGNLDAARKDLLEFKERKGWKALGYKTWAECVEAEFDQSVRRVDQLIAAAETDREIGTIVPKSAGLPEGTLRPLAGLPAGEKIAVMEEVIAEAGPSRPTAKAVKAVVDRRRGRDAVAKSVPPASSVSAPAPDPDDGEATLNIRAPGPSLPLASHRRAIERAVAEGTGCLLMLTASQAAEMCSLMAGLEGPK